MDHDDTHQRTAEHHRAKAAAPGRAGTRRVRPQQTHRLPPRTRPGSAVGRRMNTTPDDTEADRLTGVGTVDLTVFPARRAELMSAGKVP